MSGPILEMRGITKRFPGVNALDNVNLAVGGGAIHALVGENGAGKSTLMKVLSGVYPEGEYEGDIWFDGQVRRLRGIADSEALGIIIIHQELALVPLLSIAENIFLGNETAKGGVIDWFEAYARTRALLAKVGLKEPPTALITSIPLPLVRAPSPPSRMISMLVLPLATAPGPLSTSRSVALVLSPSTVPRRRVPFWPTQGPVTVSVAPGVAPARLTVPALVTPATCWL